MISRYSLTLLFTLAALGCGDDSNPTAGTGGITATGGATGTGGQAQTGGMSSTGGASDTGGVTSTGGDSAQTAPVAAAACDPGQVRCRGLCFTTVGQQQDGCELVYLRQASEPSIEMAYFGPGTAYVTTATSVLRQEDVHRIDLGSGAATTVLMGFDGFNDVQIYDGALHTIGVHDWGDGPRDAVMKLIDDGSFEPVSGMLADNQSAPWRIIDGSLYLVSLIDGLNGAIHRVALGTALDAPFYPDAEPGAELLAQDVGADNFATDGAFIYYASAAGLGRAQIGDPGSAALINEEWSFAGTQVFALPKAEPDHVYFDIAGALYRVLRTGGVSELVLYHSGGILWMDDDEALAWNERAALRHITITPPTEVVLDDDGDEIIAAWSEDAGHYVASKWGIMRLDPK